MPEQVNAMSAMGAMNEHEGQKSPEFSRSESASICFLSRQWQVEAGRNRTYGLWSDAKRAGTFEIKPQSGVAATALQDASDL